MTRFADLIEHVPTFSDDLQAQRLRVDADFPWYPYSTFGNFVHLAALEDESTPDLEAMSGARRILDIGGADGDLAFFLERRGFEVDFVDFAPTNHNGMRGVRETRVLLDSGVSIHEVDLDSQFALPHSPYGLVFALGLLYHLKNPFYFLEALARNAEWCALSTRVFQVTTDGAHRLTDVPVGYLVNPDETNGDPTNFWMFTREGLSRLLIRAGWSIVGWRSVGCLEDSDPSSSDRDERVFCLLRSTVSD
jgi:tRNA (mo5U34)-methyltransferase